MLSLDSVASFFLEQRAGRRRGRASDLLPQRRNQIGSAVAVSAGKTPTGRRGTIVPAEGTTNDWKMPFLVSAQLQPSSLASDGAASSFRIH